MSIVLSCACSVGLAKSSFAAPSNLGERKWHSAGVWRQSQGLPQDRVSALLQTRDGYLWAGTRAGLTRFDGVRFTTFDSRSASSFDENEVRALAEGQDGSLWIGTYGGGLARLHKGRIAVFGAKQGLVNDFVWSLALEASGAIWVGTDHGLSRLEDGRFQSYTTRDGLAHDVVRALYADSDGSLWIGTHDDSEAVLQRLKSGRLERVALPGVNRLAQIEDIYRDRSGALWLATLDGLFRWQGNATTRFSTADGLSSNRVRRVVEDARGSLWVATDGGVSRRDAARGVFRPLTREISPSGPIALLADREGSLWVGYRGHGLERFQLGLFANYTVEDGLPDPGVTTVFQDSAGTVWIGSARGLSALRGAGVSSYGAADGLAQLQVSALAEDGDRRLWVGTEKGLYRSQQPIAGPGAGRAPRFRPVAGDPLFARHVRVMLHEPRGVVWIGTDSDGLVRYDQGRIRVYSTKNGLPNDAVRALAPDGEGGIWIGIKSGGLARLRGDELTVLTEKDGLPNDSIQALHRDTAGSLWIATRRGVSRLRGGRIATFTVQHGLAADHVYGFVEDARNGDLWMSCGKGIFRVSKKQLEDFASGSVQSITSVAYGLEHGLVSTMSAVAHHPVGWRTSDGRVWFATLGGAAVVDPQVLETNRIAPPVRIEQLSVDQRAFDLDAGAAVLAAAGRRDLTIGYTALSFLAPEKVRFRYKLEGFDADWIEAGTRRVAYYTNLPPGGYRFRVIACNNDGLWNEAGASVELRLAPHFHQTAWFYATCALGVALLGAGTQRLRLRRALARQQELAARIEDALAQVKILRGLLPICASCKKIRDDQGYWSQMETYIHEHSEAEFSHGMCPDCLREYFPKQQGKRG